MKKLDFYQLPPAAVHVWVLLYVAHAAGATEYRRGSSGPHAGTFPSSSEHPRRLLRLTWAPCVRQARATAGFSGASFLLYSEVEPARAHPQLAVVAVPVSSGFPVQHASLPGCVWDHSSTGVHAVPGKTERSLKHHVHHLTGVEVEFGHRDVAGLRFERPVEGVRRPTALSQLLPL